MITRLKRGAAGSPDPYLRIGKDAKGSPDPYNVEETQATGSPDPYDVNAPLARFETRDPGAGGV